MPIYTVLPYCVTRSKRVKKEIILSRRKTSFYAKFQVNCSHCLPFLHGCGLHYNVLSGLSVKHEIKGLTTNYVTMHYPGRKPVYLSSLVLRLVNFASSRTSM